ncbi:hypothetical protein CAOG_05162 [Capsaspora owczarzaki ATCC 30864]|uniref:Uncharacterized protein n=1 Tax=Capsaspora owczarzaki (strain ATCC 30864) TaxID=595528 RepID=A0A0D2X3L7_CAPO3|nr:hypothetical protein CAOG_05162 [Capsaspora owczarzaki ATCC 30864]KJE94529.1 hypothetical protein CAOG_005162 [Capsaspora owczarzaki ATCC 30864]|eukprot:XP_004346847.1 hypothetical protein CAOG_05162 [Capsaspora owczarzaki ATCC 30864]
MPVEEVSYELQRDDLPSDRQPASPPPPPSPSPTLGERLNQVAPFIDAHLRELRTAATVSLGFATVLVVMRYSHHVTRWTSTAQVPQQAILSRKRIRAAVVGVDVQQQALQVWHLPLWRVWLRSYNLPPAGHMADTLLVRFPGVQLATDEESVLALHKELCKSPRSSQPIVLNFEILTTTNAVREELRKTLPQASAGGPLSSHLIKSPGRLLGEDVNALLCHGWRSKGFLGRKDESIEHTLISAGIATVDREFLTSSAPFVQELLTPFEVHELLEAERHADTYERGIWKAVHVARRQEQLEHARQQLLRNVVEPAAKLASAGANLTEHARAAIASVSEATASATQSVLQRGAALSDAAKSSLTSSVDSVKSAGASLSDAAASAAEAMKKAASSATSSANAVAGASASKLGNVRADVAERAKSAADAAAETAASAAAALKQHSAKMAESAQAAASVGDRAVSAASSAAAALKQSSSKIAEGAMASVTAASQSARTVANAAQSTLGTAASAANSVWSAAAKALSRQGRNSQPNSDAEASDKNQKPPQQQRPKDWP